MNPVTVSVLPAAKIEISTGSVLLRNGPGLNSKSADGTAFFTVIMVMGAPGERPP